MVCSVVAQADEAVLLGPPPARESYLLADRILETALMTGLRKAFCSAAAQVWVSFYGRGSGDSSWIRVLE